MQSNIERSNAIQEQVVKKLMGSRFRKRLPSHLILLTINPCVKRNEFTLTVKNFCFSPQVSNIASLPDGLACAKQNKKMHWMELGSFLSLGHNNQS